MLYSSHDHRHPTERRPTPDDANTYQPFKQVDANVTSRLREELRSLEDTEDYGGTFLVCQPGRQLTLAIAKLLV